MASKVNPIEVTAPDSEADVDKMIEDMREEVVSELESNVHMDVYVCECTYVHVFVYVHVGGRQRCMFNNARACICVYTCIHICMHTHV